MERSEGVSVEVVTDRHMFAKLAKPWAMLLKHSGNANLYLSHDWLYTWWLWFGEQSPSRLSIVCIYKNASLIAIAPFYIERKNPYPLKTLRLLGQAELKSKGEGSAPECEQLDIITNGDKNYHSLVVDTLASHLRKLGRYSSLTFHSVTECSLLYKLINHLPKHQTSGLSTQKQVPFLAMPSSFDMFVLSQSKDWRINYRGNKKKMDVTGKAEIRTYSQPHEIHAGLQSLAQILCTQQRKSSGGKCSFDTEKYMKFHEDICHLLSIKDRVEIVSLMMGGRLLASICYYRVNDDAIQVYQMASVRGDGIHFSPMLLLMMHVIEQQIELGCLRIDFLSSCLCDETEKSCSRENNTKLHMLEWYKNRGGAYFVKSSRKLYKALRGG